MIHELQQIFSLEGLQLLIEGYGKLGIMSGVILPFLEAFLPFLPLTAFMLANAATYGLVEGFLLSYIGCVAGAWTVYWVCRYFGGKAFFQKYREHSQVQKYSKWLDDKGVIIVTILCMIPVFPNFIVTIVAGLNKMHFGKYAVASATGIFGLTFVFSFIGDDLWAIVANPSKAVLIILSFGCISMISKYIERNLIVSN